VPVVAPTFKSKGWDAEVDELLVHIAPTPESDAAVAKIAQKVKQMISPIMPEAEVSGFTSGNFLSGTAFGVAVPEVEIVINVSPSALLDRLQGRWAQGRHIKPSQLDVRKLQKSAIRACTDRLVGNGAFKFRRSTFRGAEPKVTMLAPATLGICDAGVAMNLSVNAETPLYNAALFTESGQMDPRAQALIVLVKRWAKDRGLCHVAKGHLSPYAWTLLTVYFLQVGVEEEGPLLPPLKGFKTCSGLLAAAGAALKDSSSPATPAQLQAAPAEVGSKSSVGKLFKDFVHFYCKRFDWRNEAVSVRLGKRLPASVGLPLHVIVHNDGSKSDVAPSIEDPFRSASNLSECMGEANLAHLHKELARAELLCSQDASLTTMLEPWAPSDFEPEAGAAGEDEE
jgi:DNA polymerase sigma